MRKNSREGQNQQTYKKMHVNQSRCLNLNYLKQNCENSRDAYFESFYIRKSFQ